MAKDNDPLNSFPSDAYARANAAAHFGPEWRQSGSLPLQPEGMDVKPNADSPTPYKNMTNGRKP